MTLLHAIPLVLQAAIPIVLLYWLARGRNASVAGFVAKAAIVLLYLGAVHLAGMWMLLPWYAAVVFAAGAAIIVLTLVPRVQRLPWRAERLARRSLLGRAALAIVSVAVIAVALLGRWPPAEQAVDLQFPLRNGTYYVVAGGSMELVNPHLMTLAGDRFRAYRGQSYGNDLLKLNAYGMRAAGWLPRDPARYAIYGDAVHAPCSGRVVQAEDGAPDMPPPQPDRTRMAGNYVLLACGGAHVLLAHLKPGTVRARREAWIETGTVIGLVGNSGNSNEPHLHVHAQRPATAESEPLSGQPLPIRFNGRYLVRNDRVTNAGR